MAHQLLVDYEEAEKAARSGQTPDQREQIFVSTLNDKWKRTTEEAIDYVQKNSPSRFGSTAIPTRMTDKIIDVKNNIMDFFHPKSYQLSPNPSSNPEPSPSSGGSAGSGLPPTPPASSPPPASSTPSAGSPPPAPTSPPGPATRSSGSSGTGAVSYSNPRTVAEGLERNPANKTALATALEQYVRGELSEPLFTEIARNAFTAQIHADYNRRNQPLPPTWQQWVDQTTEGLLEQARTARAHRQSSSASEP